MSFLEIMQERYTTKKYDASKKIDPKQIADLKRILQLSPSSINSQPWKFTFVSDKATKEELSKISWINTEKVLDCDTLVVFSRIDNLDLFEKQVHEELAQGSIDYYNGNIKPQPAAETKAWIDKQVYLSIGVFLSACASMGIDSTPMEGLEPDNYDKVLGLENYHTLVAVAIGHRHPEDSNQPDKREKSRMEIDKVVESI